MRNVRNFWAELQVDGRFNTIETGPRASAGGMKIRILNRKQGSIDPIETVIECKLDQEGRIVVAAYDGDRQILCKTVDR